MLIGAQETFLIINQTVALINFFVETMI